MSVGQECIWREQKGDTHTRTHARTHTHTPHTHPFPFFHVMIDLDVCVCVCVCVRVCVCLCTSASCFKYSQVIVDDTSAGRGRRVLLSGSFNMCPTVQCILCSENVYTAHCMKQ